MMLHIRNSNQNALIFIWRTSNRYSITALLGAIEEHMEAYELDVICLPDNQLSDSFILENTRKYSRLILCFSFMTPDLIWIMDKIGHIRELICKNKIVNVTSIAGGAHPTGDWLNMLLAGFDIIVTGEAENRFSKLVSVLIKNQPWDEVPGIAFMKSGIPCYTDSDDELPNLNKIKPFAPMLKSFSPVEITRGCFYNCCYCQTPRIFGSMLRHRSIDNILFWAEYFSKFHLSYIRFISSNAFGYGSEGLYPNPQKIHDLLKGLREQLPETRIYFGSFPSEVRPEYVTMDILESVKEFANNRSIVIGAQSGSQRVLELMNRNHSVEDVEKAVELAVLAGLEPHVDIMFGIPGENQLDRETTVKFVRRLTKSGAIVYCHRFIPLSGTAWALEEPSVIDDKLRSILEELSSKGVMRGNWRNHQKIVNALKIVQKR